MDPVRAPAYGRRQSVPFGGSPPGGCPCRASLSPPRSWAWPSSRARRLGRTIPPSPTSRARARPVREQRRLTDEQHEELQAMRAELAETRTLAVATHDRVQGLVRSAG